MIQNGSVKTNIYDHHNPNPTKSIKIRSSHSIFKVLCTIIIISQLCGYCWTKEIKNKKLNVLEYDAQRLDLDRKLEDIGENFGVVKSEKNDLDIENQLFVVDAFIDSHRHILSKRQVEEGSGESDDGGNTDSNSESETGTNIEDETNNSNSDTTNDSTNGNNSGSASSFKTKSSIVSSFLAIFVYYFLNKK